MAFSIGRQLSSFISDLTPRMFKSNLGPLDAVSAVRTMSEVPRRGAHDPSQKQKDLYLGVEKNARATPTLGQYWNQPLKNGRTRAQALDDIGSILRDPDDGFMAEAPDPLASLPSFSPSRGGGVGGVGGVASRRTGRWTA